MQARATERIWLNFPPAQVWVYPMREADGRLHFLADSDAHITKGIVALVLLTVQDRTPAEIRAADIEGALAPFESEDRALFTGREDDIVRCA